MLVAYQTLSITVGLLPRIASNSTVEALQVLSLGNLLGVLNEQYTSLLPLITLVVVVVQLLPLIAITHLI